MILRYEYFLGLGSNVPDRVQNLASCCASLATISKIVSASSVYQSRALLINRIVSTALDDLYYNMVLRVFSNLEPIQLLKNIKQIEKYLGRNLDLEKWSRRVIDIDILLAGSTVLDSTNLRIPHVELLYRDFCLRPIVEISPNTIHPFTSNTLYDEFIFFSTFNNGIIAKPIMLSTAII